ncbi:MAG: hypothetical protein OSA43_09630 [Pirellulales bacterium]|nr:hypothetical protein [Pirellulales bacterium]
MLPHLQRRSRRNVRSRAGQQCLFNRRGAATLDFALVLGVLLPIAAVVIGMGSRIMQLVYEMLAVFLAWPFM